MVSHGCSDAVALVVLVLMLVVGASGSVGGVCVLDGGRLFER